MGLFDALFGGRKSTNVEEVPDRIWMTAEAKFLGLAEEAKKQAESATDAILLVAHFPDVLERLDRIAQQQTAGAPVTAVIADSLTLEMASIPPHDSSRIEIIVGERHPSLSQDEEIRQFARELPCRCRLSHHLSLEDPALATFAGDWVQRTLGMLGMEPDEAIESEMVSRRIRQAQKKIAAKAVGDARADSVADWMRQNCPAMWSK